MIYEVGHVVAGFFDMDAYDDQDSNYLAIKFTSSVQYMQGVRILRCFQRTFTHMFTREASTTANGFICFSLSPIMLPVR